MGALAIDPIKLEVIPHSEFHARLRPPDIEKEEYLTEDRLETVNFHARVMGITPNEVVEAWKGGGDTKTTWELFSAYVNRFNLGKSMHTAPVAAGCNIKGFDLPIAQRLNDKFNVKTMFYARDIIDLQDIVFYWFEGLNYGPVNYKLDSLRQFFKMPVEGGHDALQDVRDEASLIIKFMKLHRECAAKVTAWKELSQDYGKGTKV
jgi:hypothetical protein